MKTNLLRFSLFVALFALFNIVTLPKTAHAQAIAFQWRFAGKGADASWETCADEYHCSYKSIYVSETMYRQDGTKFRGTTLSYYESTYDMVNNTSTYKYGFLENPSFTVNKKLTAVTVAGTVPVTACTYDYNTETETCVDNGTVQVSASWNGNGELVRGSSKGHYQSKSFTSVYSFRGSWRQAVATATINGQALGPSSWGSIFNYRDASVYICRSGC